MQENILSVHSEIGELKRLLVHSPDKGLGKVIPSKAQDWLFEDIVHLKSIREGYVFGTARIIHKGRSLHLWEIKITDEEGNLVENGKMTRNEVGILLSNYCFINIAFRL